MKKKKKELCGCPKNSLISTAAPMFTRLVTSHYRVISKDKIHKHQEYNVEKINRKDPNHQTLIHYFIKVYAQITDQNKPNLRGKRTVLFK
jgi:hypothetical protein